MAHIFISYARTNRNYAFRLKEALEGAGIETWVDLENLDPGSIWQREIESAIDGCFAFIYLLSKESIASEYCQNEFGYALEEKKKIIPIRLPGINDSDVPAEISAFQWLTWEDFEEGLSAPDKLFKSIRMDLAWAKFHADLMIKAKKWESSKTNSDLLLRGKEIREAEKQIEEGQEYPKTTSLQYAYLFQSKKHEVNGVDRLV